MYLEVHNMLRRERYCRKHLTTWPKRTKVGNIFRCVMSLPPKAQLWDAYMRFWFWCSKHGRWQFFSWGQDFNLRQGPKEQKNYGPRESWGGCTDSRSGSPTMCDGAQMVIFGDFFASCICSEPSAACFRPAS